MFSGEYIRELKARFFSSLPKLYSDNKEIEEMLDDFEPNRIRSRGRHSITEQELYMIHYLYIRFGKDRLVEEDWYRLIEEDQKAEDDFLFVI